MNKNIALVLSGGGARGIAHIGVIEGLERQGFTITSVAGTSMGALVGGIYALGKLHIYKEWICNLSKMKMFRLLDFNFSGQGLVRGDKLFNALRELIDDALIEDLHIPYAAVAADIINKKEVVFTEGSLLNAIRASIAIPTILTPVKTADGFLVDGGVINNLPIDHVKRQPGDILVAVNVNAATQVEKAETPMADHANGRHPGYQDKITDFYEYLHKLNPLKHDDKFGYFDVINKTISLITYHTCQLSLEKYSPDILVNISHECCSTFDFYRGGEMIELGKHAANKALESYNNKAG